MTFNFSIRNDELNFPCVTYVPKRYPYFNEINIIRLYYFQIGNELLNSSILETIQALYALQNLQTRGTTDREVIHSAVDLVDNTIKKMADTSKKKLSSSFNKIHITNVKKITKKWEPIRKLSLIHI